VKSIPFSICAVLVINALTIGVSLSQDAIDEPQPELTREEWKARIEAARRRAEDSRRDHVIAAPAPPTETAKEEELSRRAIEDDSLQPGDIVSTNRGFFRFKGRPLEPRQPDDFVPMAAPPWSTK
jgi:hypothetical protein